MVATVSDPNQLSNEQRELIAAAAENRGTLAVVSRAETQGKAVHGKDRIFYDADNKEVAASYIKELKPLEKMLLLRQGTKRDTWELTNIGWLVGRKLKDTRQPEEG